MRDARPGHARLLVEEVALGEEHEPQARAPQAVHRLLGAVQQHHRHLQHPPPELDQLPDLGAGDPAVGHLHRGLDHREREPLHAIAEEPEVAALHREQALLQVGDLGVATDDLGEPLLGVLVALLVVPEGVVAVDADHPDSLEGLHRLEIERPG